MSSAPQTNSTSQVIITTAWYQPDALLAVMVLGSVVIGIFILLLILTPLYEAGYLRNCSCRWNCFCLAHRRAVNVLNRLPVIKFLPAPALQLELQMSSRSLPCKRSSPPSSSCSPPTSFSSPNACVSASVCSPPSSSAPSSHPPSPPSSSSPRSCYIAISDPPIASSSSSTSSTSSLSHLSSSSSSTTSASHLSLSSLSDSQLSSFLIDHVCAICLEDFAASQQLRVLPCLHAFHQHCVDSWLLSQFVCPVCKQDISVGRIGLEKTIQIRLDRQAALQLQAEEQMPPPAVVLSPRSRALKMQSKNIKT